jgi:hypothetical protein
MTNILTTQLQRRLYRDSGSWEDLMDHLAQMLTSELDVAAPASAFERPPRERLFMRPERAGTAIITA